MGVKYTVLDSISQYVLNEKPTTSGAAGDQVSENVDRLRAASASALSVLYYAFVTGTGYISYINAEKEQYMQQ